MLGFRRPRPRSFLPALAIAGAGALAFVGVTLAMVGIFYFVGVDLDSFRLQRLVRMIDAEAPGWTLASAALLAIVGAPLVEELLFRSVLYQPLRARLGVVPAALIVAALFAGVHLYAWGMPQLMVLSLVFVALFERTGSLWYPIVAHGLYNGATFVLIRVVTLPGG